MDILKKKLIHYSLFLLLNISEITRCIHLQGKLVICFINYIEILKYLISFNFVRFEVLTAVTMKNAVFWDVMSCDSCKIRRFRGIYRLQHQGDKNQ
jgi:hypothetical protein